ncbi:MarR family winged helix-turn-helix transcriptional regulator [Aquibium microcysteis]|uniref:MarR family winged helix-turn-helix transcriptional regulator n=1 Tax=Aquibium microcysteis TaxID=675281 RepID=UPI00165CEF8B|nr:MarR family winged helix-turn-helix transcriptional regulator [Aquibium microcysteis]
MTTDGHHSLGFLIHDIARLLRKRFDARAAGTGLSSAQWRLLFRLIRDEGVPQARLAEILDIEPISVSRLLDRMEEGGWIERRPHATDRRVRVIYATGKARDAFGEVKGMVEDIYEEAMAGLSPEARQQLLASLEQVRTNVADGEPGCLSGTVDPRRTTPVFESSESTRP